MLLYLPSLVEPGMVDGVEVAVSTLGSLKEQAIAAVDLLQAPPADQRWETALPPGTRVLSIFRDGETVVVDLSHEFLAERPLSVSQARQRIYALVNTLTSLPDVEAVRLLVGEEERTNYFNFYDLTATYRFNRSVIAAGAHSVTASP